MAAVELLSRAFGGRFAADGYPWIVHDGTDRVWLGGAALRQASALSAGERRVLSLVAALVDALPVDIVGVVTGLDRERLDLVLAALAYTGGSHMDTAIDLGSDRTVQLSRSGQLHPWPDIPRR
ncbi:hypothetical protein [uncultured Cellulomonas sp.]|uniref:hypothetical protein n=1 Tax=uncultured Cellulomonas sp. TaxID=189682 RepID=UPI002630F8CF|nr:hypothetical protein [uncultured Cellulomonas sp.]